MLTGAGGASTQHYVGLLADGPACLAAVIMAAADQPAGCRAGALKTAWWCMTAALALYLRRHGHRDRLVAASSATPFRAPADIFFLAFYPAVFAAVLFFVRARAMRMPWAPPCARRRIFAVGFGAFVLVPGHPASSTAQATRTS